MGGSAKSDDRRLPGYAVDRLLGFGFFPDFSHPRSPFLKFLILNLKLDCHHFGHAHFFVFQSAHQLCAHSCHQTFGFLLAQVLGFIEILLSRFSHRNSSLGFRKIKLKKYTHTCFTRYLGRSVGQPQKSMAELLFTGGLKHTKGSCRCHSSFIWRGHNGRPCSSSPQ